MGRSGLDTWAEKINMESEFPVFRPTRQCFKKALAAYQKRFLADPPGAGFSEARYQAIILALEVNQPATEQDIADFEVRHEDKRK